MQCQNAKGSKLDRIQQYLPTGKFSQGDPPVDSPDLADDLGGCL